MAADGKPVPPLPPLPQPNAGIAPCCRHCGGSGIEPAALDVVALLAAIAEAIGATDFTTSDLLEHAALTGGPLREILEPHSAKAIGRALRKVEGHNIDGRVLRRLGKERDRVALWRLCRF